MKRTLDEIINEAEILDFRLSDNPHPEASSLRGYISLTSTAAERLYDSTQALRKSKSQIQENTFILGAQNLLTALNETFLSLYRLSAQELGMQDHLTFDSRKSKTVIKSLPKYSQAIMEAHPELAEILNIAEDRTYQELRNGAAHLDLTAKLHIPGEEHTEEYTHNSNSNYSIKHNPISELEVTGISEAMISLITNLRGEKPHIRESTFADHPDDDSSEIAYKKNNNRYNEIDENFIPKLIIETTNTDAKIEAGDMLRLCYDVLSRGSRAINYLYGRKTS